MMQTNKIKAISNNFALINFKAKQKVSYKTRRGKTKQTSQNEAPQIYGERDFGF